MAQSVLIVRKRLLPFSETFIAAQATHLPTFKPVFAGISRDASGSELLEGQTVCVQNEHAVIPALSRGMLSLFGMPDRRWLAGLKAHDPSIVHAHFGPSGVYGLALGQALNIPVVVTFHGYDITQDAVSPRYQKQRQTLFLQADKIIAVSDFIRQRLIAAGCPEDRVVTHYIGIEPGVAREPTIQRSTNPLIVFIGRLVRQKGCDHLITAFQKVREQVPAAQLQVIGTGPELEALKSQAQTVGGITFSGRLTPAEVRQVLQKAWLLCNPSVIDEQGATEGLGMVFLEAQALGTPAISYNTGGVVEAIVDGKTGYTLELGDREQLANKIIDLLGDATLRENMGEAGRRHIDARFNLSKQCTILEEHYGQVISNYQSGRQ